MAVLKQKKKIKVCVIEIKGSVAKMVEMGGKNSMLTSKLNVLLTISAPY